MRYASICSGIEAASVAFKPLGWICEFVAEIEPFPCKVLKHHYPEVPNYGDITKYQEWPMHTIDVLIGGTPCQSFSVAGLRAGLRDPRGNLALIFLGIVERYRPRYVLWENVPGVHSSWSDETTHPPSDESRARIEEARRACFDAGLDLGPGLGTFEFEEVNQSNDFDCFLAGLAELGYGVAHCLLDAQFFHLAQRRERVFVVGCAGGQWQCAAAILSDSESLRRDSAPRREKREGITHDVAPCIGASGRGFDRTGDTRGQDAVIPIQEIGKRQSGTPMNGVGHGQPGDPMYTLQAGAVHGIAHTLKAEGHDASEDGTGRGVPLVAATLDANFGKLQGCSGQDLNHGHSHLVPETAWALQERDSKGSDSSTKDGHLIPVAYRSSGNCGVMEQGDKTAALNTNTDQTQQIVAFQQNQLGEVRAGEVAGTLNQNSNASGRNTPMIKAQTAVRRLTPVECEALQGFPRGYTKIDDKTADGPRYRSLGNSFPVPVIKWIGGRIQLVDSIPFHDQTKPNPNEQD